MKRLVFGTLSILFLAGVVAAWVQAQDQPDPVQTRGLAAPSAAMSSGDVTWSQHLTSVERTVAEDYVAAELGNPNTSGRPDPTMLAVNDDDLGGLHSVLKRPGATSSTPTPPAVGDTGIRTATRSVEPLIPPTHDTEESETQPAFSALPAATPSTVLPASNDAANGPTSSRRTYREPRAENQSNPAVVRDEPKLMHPPSYPSRTTAETPRRTDEPVQSMTSVSITDKPAMTTSMGALLRVDTVGPAAITLGEEALFVVRLSNSGDTEALGVAVRVAVPESVQVAGVEASAGQTQSQPVPGDAAKIVWALDRLAARSIQQLTLRVVPQSHQAFDLTVDWSVQPVTSMARIEVQQPLLEIAVNGPTDVEFGDSKVYTIIVSNPGTGATRDVSIDVTMGDETANTLHVSDIPPGGEKSFEMKVTAQTAGMMQISASATAASQLNAKAAHQVRVRRADLKLEAVGPPLQYSGTVGTYQVRLSNTGDATVRDVQAAVRLPQGVRYLEGLTGARQDGDSLAWTIGELAPGADRRFEFACELAGDGQMLLRFVGRSVDGLQASADVQTRVEAIADLKLTVNDPKGPIRVGRNVIYEIQVQNRGTKEATDVNVVAQFSEGIEPVATEGHSAKIEPGQVVFDSITRIAPQETVKLTVTAQADKEGNHVFRAAVGCSTPETRLSAEDTTRFYGSSRLQTNNDSPAPPTDDIPAPQLSGGSIYGNSLE